ncbi:MAG TPA: hypothetical protein VJ974_08005, partial [Geopsychrobacteraceae bacterium]|nr:hypothetical protein [Geopsychrobacteraceae bacterium]
MKKLFSVTILSLLLFFMLFCAAFWRFPDQMLNGLVRPPLESIAAGLLDAEIYIDRLHWTGSGLEINALQLTSPQMNGRVPQITLNFTWASLWDRQFNEVLISSPQLALTPSAGRKSAPGQPLQLPTQLPLQIERLQLSDGQLTINSP